ncbi:SMP-30/gluconolactonase/LRE family protein [Nocardioides sp. CFH 31398]|uniref:SMP-30/gluconolactonase/LRE family protein n=1 Tax=Nocardioides sp. CFH 31398 TaxID=2919579 RepID=UPI001F065980|nr:SMP-30/gluconolactonase/LRE family protein [Nocardioides sp. CFH 31398]MCH1866680.1 SMP-30/gluconolactonase/LRE family protein [Nocardioides sp. CFH 31398]
MRLTVLPIPGVGPEDVLVHDLGPHTGSLVVGVDDGSLLRITPDGRRATRVASTGGRPLGLEWLPDGRVLVCDSTRGLLAVDLASGAVEPLVSTLGGRAMRFCNNAAVAADGTVWFTDSSLHHGREQWEEEMAQDTRTGRLLRRDPDGRVDVVLDDLSFANGVVVDPGGAWITVNETGAARIRRHHLSGDRAGTTDVLVDGLPGYPDNASLGTDGLVWVALASPVVPLLAVIHRLPPVLRRASTRAPAALRPSPRRSVRVQAYDGATGTLVHDLDATPQAVGDRAFHFVTGVREHHGRVWLGSLEEPAVAVLDGTRGTGN